MKNQVVVIDIGVGNLASVVKAVIKAGGSPKISNNAHEIEAASRLILPGVGAYGAGSRALSQLGLVEPIQNAVLEKKVPIMGFCMGMQLFSDHGDEGGVHKGLGLLSGCVQQLDVTKCDRLPHIGWNDVYDPENNSLYDGLGASPHFYFVHSFHMKGLNESVKVSHCSYGDEVITASVEFENIYGLQFHPEKSLMNGIVVIRNFINNA